MRAAFQKYYTLLTTADHPGSPYLTGLRAYAALMVFMIHSGGFGLRSLHPVLNNFVDHGRYGVILFFVLSGFVVSLSILKAGDKFNFPVYASRRCLRILPLYYILLVVVWAFGLGSRYWAEAFSTPYDFKSMALHFVFYGLYDQRHMVNGLSVEWSIPIEFSFYMILPLWVWASGTSWRWVVAVVATLAFYKFFDMMPNLLPEGSQGLKNHWSPAHYIPYFLAPCILAVIMTRFRSLFDKWNFSWAVPLAFVLCAAYVTLNTERYAEAVYGAITLMLLVGLDSPSRLRRVLFENKIVIWLGMVKCFFPEASYKPKNARRRNINCDALSGDRDVFINRAPGDGFAPQI